MAVSTKMAVFWVVTLCRLIQVYQLFRGPYCLHHQGEGDDYDMRKDLVRDKGASQSRQNLCWAHGEGCQDQATAREPREEQGVLQPGQEEKG
jgi:hypothetical protein